MIFKLSHDMNSSALCPQLLFLCPLFWHHCVNQTQQIGHGSDKTSGRSAFRGPHTVIARFTPPIHFHSSFCVCRKTRFYFKSHIWFPAMRQMCNHLFHKCREWPVNSSPRTFLCDFVIRNSYGIFSYVQHPSLYFLPFLSYPLSPSKTGGAHMWKWRVMVQQ